MDLPWDELKQKISNADLEPELAASAARFLDEFSALPAEPYTVNPHYLRFLLTFLIEDICSAEEVPVLWWEVTLDLARKWAADRGDAGVPALEAIDALHPLLDERFPNDDADVSLQEITRSTVFAIIMLSETLSGPKQYFVAPNAISLAQAPYNPKAWARAIYAGRKPVGFVMLSVDEEEGEYFVWRFMLGEPYHGRGLGRKAMEAIMAHVRTLPKAKELQLSHGQGPGSPEGFYKKIGFVPTGKVEHGEVFARIEL